ncbi:MAG TPA: sigma-70 family RNA polymerase sigma factor [candidate division Zixibacteria bacterium]|nr:sigma-70 family RNA polymerase sigma factor [candidate division Zixibacteria bacterium]
MDKKPDIERMQPAEDDRDEVNTKALVSRIKRGDQRAFAELMKRYRSQVAALAYRMVGDYDEAADITQIVFVKVNHNIWRYDEKKKFYTWLYRITVNACIDYIRKHRRHQHEPLDNYHELLQSDDSTPEDRYHRERIRDYIHQATRKLNEKQRSAFMLRDIEGCKLDRVAEVMDIPEATVRWYLHRARGKIRKELQRKCPQLLLMLGIK